MEVHKEEDYLKPYVVSVSPEFDVHSLKETGFLAGLADSPLLLYCTVQCPQKKARGSGKISGFLYLLQI